MCAFSFDASTRLAAGLEPKVLFLSKDSPQLNWFPRSDVLIGLDLLIGRMGR